MAKIDVKFCQYLSRFGCLYYSTEKKQTLQFYICGTKRRRFKSAMDI